MRYRTDGSGLDCLTTPIILCNPEGTVIYKNDNAVRQIRLPKRNTDMKTHLDGAGRLELSEIAPGRRPSVITVYTGDRNAKAFVCAYEKDGADCTLWVFSAFLQSNPSGAFFSAMEKELERLGTDLCALIKNLDRQSKSLSGKSQTALKRRIDERMEHLLDELFASRTERAYWQVGESLRILKDQIGTLFADYGYQIGYEESVLREHLHKYLNFRDFLAFYSHTLTFCCELTRNRKITLSVRSAEDESAIELTTRFTVMFPPLYADRERDISRLLPYFPDHQVEILMLDKLVSCCGCQICYSILDQRSENVTISFRMPLSVSRGFSAVRDVEREKRLMQIDCYHFVERLLILLPDLPTSAD